MENLHDIVGFINEIFESNIVSFSEIMSVLTVVMLLSTYLCLIYRMFSHRAFYNKAFHMSITIIPFFISTIILCLQSNLIITLGTIGALAIIRFRTAVKDPVDMIYILWAIHIGICCGCKLTGLAIITSVVVTFVLAILDFISIAKVPYTLVINCDSAKEDDIINLIRPLTNKFRIKSRNYTRKGLNMVIELFSDDVKSLGEKLSKENTVERFSIIEYDYEDII